MHEALDKLVVAGENTEKTVWKWNEKSINF